MEEADLTESQMNRSARDVAAEEAIAERQAEQDALPPQVELLEQSIRQAQQELLGSVEEEDKALGALQQAKERVRAAEKRSERSAGRMEALQEALTLAREYKPVE